MLGYGALSLSSCSTRTTIVLQKFRCNPLLLERFRRRELSATSTSSRATERGNGPAVSSVPDPRNQKVLHAAIAGLPNSGKSTLLNYVVGDKVSAVSTKRHTTRENTLGVMTVGTAQVFFHDTPGFVSHEERGDYQPALSAASREAIELVNLTLLLVDASKDVTKRGLRSLTGLLEKALRSRCELFLVLNKVDMVNPKHRLLTTTDDIMDRAQEIMDQIDRERAEAAVEIPPFSEGGKTVDDHITVFMVSAKTGDGVEDIVDILVNRARPGSWLFGREETTNKDKRSRVMEIVREGLYKHLYKELPYQVKTQIKEMSRKPDGSVSILQDLRVERTSQKSIVLGKLRHIKKDVEWDLRKLFGTRTDVRFSVIGGHKKG